MKFLRGYWPVLLLIALPILFLADVWFGGKILFLRDYYWSEGVNRFAFGQSIREGVFPFWNSLWQCGSPNAAQPYYCTFYPINWIFVFPNVEWDNRLLWSFHLALASVSAYALARYWKLSVFPALLAGVAFAYSTCLIAIMEFAHSFCCIAWLPLTLLLADKIIDATAAEPPAAGGRAGYAFPKSAGTVAGLALVLAMQVLACPENTYFSALIVGFYVIAKWIWARDFKTAWVSALCLGVAGLLALGISAPQWVPTFELVRHSIRATGFNAMEGMSSAHPRSWLTLLLPFLYGRPGYPNGFWAPNVYEFSYGTLYVGVLPLIGAIFCWHWAKTRTAGSRCFQVWLLIAIGVAGLIMAAGNCTPVYGFLHHWLPGLGRSRFPSKFYLFPTVALALLGGFGFQALLENRDPRATGSRRLWQVAMGIFGVFIFGFFVCLLFDPVLKWLMANPHGATPMQVDAEVWDYAWAALFTIAGLVLFGLLAFGIGESRWIQGGIVAVAFANLCVVSRQIHPTGPEGVYTRRPEQLISAVGHQPQYRFWSIYCDAQQYIYGDKRVGVYDWARNTGASNYMLLEGISNVATGGMVLNRYQELFGALLSPTPQIHERAADLMALRYVSVGAPFPDVLWNNASSEVHIAERKDAPARAFIVPSWKFMTDEKAILQTLFSDKFNPRTEALLEPLGRAPAPTPSILCSPGEVRHFQDRGNSLTLEASTQDTALLVLSDTWYPGWTVKVDGVEKPIFRANYNFRGVFLEPGTHRVEFSYWPTCFTGALWLCALSLAICGLLWRMARPRCPKPDKAAARRTRVSKA